MNDYEKQRVVRQVDSAVREALRYQPDRKELWLLRGARVGFYSVSQIEDAKGTVITHQERSDECWLLIVHDGPRFELEWVPSSRVRELS